VRGNWRRGRGVYGVVAVEIAAALVVVVAVVEGDGRDDLVLGRDLAIHHRSRAAAPVTSPGAPPSSLG
jgi:hypothetical protein